jgi:hypothetical protein
MALVRDLFGLTVDNGRAIEHAPAEPADLSEIRELPERRT